MSGCTMAETVNTVDGGVANVIVVSVEAAALKMCYCFNSLTT